MFPGSERVLQDVPKFPMCLPKGVSKSTQKVGEKEAPVNDKRRPWVDEHLRSYKYQALASILGQVRVEGERSGDHGDDNFQVSTTVLHLVAIACIMLVAVHMTETARELHDGVRGVPRNREQVASVHTKAELTGFQAAFLTLYPPVF
jgi:hypothetical protein